MTVEITGVHPYAEEFPMASDDELDELTESVASVGLIHAIVVTPDGLVLDGRNRLEACNRAQVEARLEVREGDDDDYKEFVIGVNTTGRRESMTVQIAAASSALVLGEGRRREGKWDNPGGRGNRGRTSTVSEPAHIKALTQCGLILDTLGRDGLRRVRDRQDSLNAVYEQACSARDEQQSKADREAAEQAAESAARTFVEEHDPSLAEQVGGALIPDWRAAQANYEQRHREEVAARKREESMRAAARQEELNAWGRACDGLKAALSWASDFTPPADTDIWPTVDQFTERANRLAQIVNEWNTEKSQ